MSVRRRRSPPFRSSQGPDDVAADAVLFAEDAQEVRERCGASSPSTLGLYHRRRRFICGELQEEAPSSPQHLRQISHPPLGPPEVVPVTHPTGTLAHPLSHDDTMEREEKLEKFGPNTTITNVAVGDGNVATDASPSDYHIIDSQASPLRLPILLPSNSSGPVGTAGVIASDNVASRDSGSSDSERLQPPPSPRPTVRTVNSDTPTAGSRAILGTSASGRDSSGQGGSTSGSDLPSSRNPSQHGRSSSVHEPTWTVAVVQNSPYHRLRPVDRTERPLHSQSRPVAEVTGDREISTTRPQNSSTSVPIGASALLAVAVDGSNSHGEATFTGGSSPSRVSGDDSPSDESTSGAGERNSSGNGESGRGPAISTGVAGVQGTADVGGAVAATGTSYGAASTIGSESSRPASTSINQLHKASVVGDLTSISRFIKDGGNLEAQSFCGRTALHYAAFYGHADVARALVLAGANVCSRGGGNSTPLHFAAWGGNKKVVRLLLDYGADVEARDTEGNPPQAYSEDDELYEMLIKARRKDFPVPTQFLSRSAEARPVMCLTIYIAVVVLIVGAATLILTCAISSNPGGQGVVDFIVDARIHGGTGKSGRREDVSASVDISSFFLRFGAIWDVPVRLAASVGLPTVFMLLAGFAPSVVLIVAYKRRTKTFWSSLKARDEEIVRLRYREQAAGGWLLPTAIQPAANSRADNDSPNGATTAGRGASLVASPRGTSRGEQAGRAVIARLSRLQAAAIAAGAAGARGGSVGNGGAEIGQSYQQQQALLRQQLEIRRYQQALRSGSEEDTDDNRDGAASHSMLCVQVAQ